MFDTHTWRGALNLGGKANFLECMMGKGGLIVVGNCSSTNNQQIFCFVFYLMDLKALLINSIPFVIEVSNLSWKRVALV